MGMKNRLLSGVAAGAFCFLGASAALASSEHETDNLLVVAYIPAMPDEDSGAYLVFASDETGHKDAYAKNAPKSHIKPLSLKHTATSGHTFAAGASKEPIVLASAAAYGSSPVLTREELEYLRGGFVFNGGLKIDFSFRQETKFNGETIGKVDLNLNQMFGEDGLFGKEGVLGNQQQSAVEPDKSWKSPDSAQPAQTASAQSIQGPFGTTQTDGKNTKIEAAFNPTTIQQAAAVGSGGKSVGVTANNVSSAPQKVGGNIVQNPVFQGNGFNFGKLIQVGVNGSPTPVITDLPGLTTIVQNSLNQVNIQHSNVMDILVQGVDNYKMQQFVPLLNHQAISALK